MRKQAIVALLQDYLRHHERCRIFRCVQCGTVRENDDHYAGAADNHQFVAFPCDCGLDEAMAQIGLPTRRP